jgi:hypothetical protein
MRSECILRKDRNGSLKSYAQEVGVGDEWPAPGHGRSGLLADQVTKRDAPHSVLMVRLRSFPLMLKPWKGSTGIPTFSFSAGCTGRTGPSKKRFRERSPLIPEKGVFAIRSPSRPNPVSLTVVKLRGVKEGRIFKVSFLDLIDGTPVIDLKPYQPGTDSVFSAKNPDRSGKIGKIAMERYRDDLILEAVGFHGE